MYLSFVFFFSGVVLAVLLVAKRMDEKRKTGVFLLKLISRGEERARELHREAIKRYSQGKDQTHFFIRKQLPRYSKSSFNKLLAYLEESIKKYFNNLRDSRLLKKDEGISEFFKSMAEVEKGNGQIDGEIYIKEPTTDNLQPTAKPKQKRSRKKVKKILVQEEI